MYANRPINKLNKHKKDNTKAQQSIKQHEQQQQTVEHHHHHLAELGDNDFWCTAKRRSFLPQAALK